MSSYIIYIYIWIQADLKKIIVLEQNLSLNVLLS